MLEELKWVDAHELRVEGRGWQDTDTPFGRWPMSAKGRIPDIVWDIGRNSAGVTVRFESDADAIHARWTLENSVIQSKWSPQLAHSGLDLYARTDFGEWRWVGVSREMTGEENESPLSPAAMAGCVGRRDFMVYLPIANPVLKLEIGIPEDAEIGAAPAREEKPIVCYGTSICHGMGVSRAGMTHLAMLGRRLDREVVNLGVSGNAKMEVEIADVLAELDASLFIIDALPNMEPGLVAERAEPFLRRLTTARPEVPVLLVEDRTYPAGWIASVPAEQNAGRRRELRRAYDAIVADGVTSVRYLEGETLLGEDGDGTCDGSHPNDLGASRIADALEQPVRGLLRGDQ